MPSLQTRPFMRFVAALMQCALLISHAQAHEMEGIDHVHLSEGVVQIIEPIPGATSAPEVRPAQTGKAVEPKAAQPSGVASLIVQAGLIVSAVVLLVVALRALPRGRRREQTREETRHAPSQPTTPVPPA
ncbi:MAG: hypothetical protein HZA59_09130 [Hydrogenophilales bacterium]|nr:hypothetical protein [Hydrogenophilales bacterium]